MPKEKTFFGFKEVSKTDKNRLVGEVFSSVASKYDIMNDIMSGGLHRIWKKLFLKEITKKKGRILDMASGSGDIAISLYEDAEDNSKPQIVACDASSEILEVGRAKALDRGITDIEYVTSFAEELPFESNSFDYYLVSFGIRNFTDIDKSLKEAYRVLKPGGKFLCLEFSKEQKGITSKLYEFYTMKIIPQIGQFVTGDKDSYQYFVESIRKFPSPEEFKTKIKNVGFLNVEDYNMTFDVVSITSGYKPS